MLDNYLLVMVGAGVGALCRYLLLLWWPSRFDYLTGVWAVNILGSFLLGFVVTLGQGNHSALLTQTGFLGGLTTFSTMMTQAGQKNGVLKQVIYLFLQVGAGSLAFFIGQAVGVWLR
ncbi:putative fluoride ion transporter CrcB [Fructobacillus pseudoficulneus]|uniref:Fluoride-specific ion channel FluC n=1 Tax=Fructobacillus pseudoficulneus TaxID=220714 RepID=A0A3F3H4Q6_9LACO|nr:CrcB family protein [Fructobacillus pseudoficulneus]GAP03308.1 putative fluoride ion transporter CrcB [Fructobacillus pseudoficulneus]SEH44137.1 CrcB protein [Fructobacillus pseudoficulneus]